MDFSNKTVLVTGSSRGIGKEIALHFAKAKANVVLNARSKSEYFDELIEIFEKENYSYMVEYANVAKQAEVIKMYENIKEKFNGVDILVNNAGITKDNLLLRLTETDFDDVIDVNLKGVYNCSKYCLRYMLSKREGRIISISSVVGINGNAGQTNYSASKAAVMGFSKSLAKEVSRKGITCNVIAAGFIQSEMTSVLDEKIKAEYKKRIPAARFGNASDIADSVLFLASDKAKYITGHVLNVDGGLVL